MGLTHTGRPEEYHVCPVLVASSSIWRLSPQGDAIALSDKALFYGFAGEAQLPRAITFGDVIVDFSGYTASDSSRKIDIMPKEIDLLRLLVEHKGLVLTRLQILDELWGADYPIIDRTVDPISKICGKSCGWTVS